MSGRMTLSTRMRRTLTPEQLAAWHAFEQGAKLELWQLTLEAWAERFPWPPMGDAGDDEGQSQRSILWRIVEDWPRRTAAWIREAPKGASAFAVVAYVDRAWKSECGQIDEQLGPVAGEEPWVRQATARAEAGRDRDALVRIGDVVRGEP